MDRCACGRLIAGGFQQCFRCHLKSLELVDFRDDRRNFSDINYWEWADSLRKTYEEEMTLNVAAERVEPMPDNVVNEHDEYLGRQA